MTPFTPRLGTAMVDRGSLRRRPLCLVVVALLVLVTGGGCVSANWAWPGLIVSRYERLAELVSRYAASGRSPDLGGAIRQALSSSQASAVQQSVEYHRRRQILLLQRILDLEPIGGDEFERLWKIDFDLDAEPAGRVLARLADEMEVRLERFRVAEGVLDQPVTLHLAGVSRIEAMDAVCAAIGIHTELLPSMHIPSYFGDRPTRYDQALAKTMWDATRLYPEEDFESELVSYGAWTSKEVLAPLRRPMVVLAPGPAPGLRQYHGPFTLLVPPVDEYVGDAAGKVKVCLSSIAVPPQVRRLWMAAKLGMGPDGVAQALTRGLSAIADTAGVHADLPGIQPYEQFEESVPMLPMTSGMKIPLVRLLRDVRDVQLAGKVVAWLPGEVETIRIEAPATRPRRVAGTDAAVTILPRPAGDEAPFRRVRSDLYPFVLPIDLEVPVGAWVLVVGVNEAGEPIGLTGLRARYAEGPPPEPAGPGHVVLQSQFSAARAPAAIIVKVLRSTRRMELPLELSVPLARHAAQPVALKPLVIEGDKPLSFTVDTDPFGSPYYRLENRTNKGIVLVWYARVCEDESGPLPRDLEQRLYGVPGYETGAGIILQPGATRKWPPDFFFRQALHHKIHCKTIDVLKVEFADGSVWVDPEWAVEEAKRPR